jgi:aldehyde dehydrogenase (NAD+)
MELSFNKYPFLKDLSLKEVNSGASAGPDDWSPISNRELMDVITPIDGTTIARVALANEQDYEYVGKVCCENFSKWKIVPAPKRGEIVRQLAEEFRRLKEPLGKLITL